MLFHPPMPHISYLLLQSAYADFSPHIPNTWEISTKKGLPETIKIPTIPFLTFPAYFKCQISLL